MDLESHSGTDARIQVLRWLQGLAALSIVALFVTPTTIVEHGPSLCLYRALTGRECYGCGMTRALSHLLHGDVSGARERHAGSFAVLPALVLLAASGCATFRRPVTR